MGEEWMATAKDYGFTKQEFSQVADHRLLLVLNDLTRLKKAEASKKEVVHQKKRRVKTNVRPNSRTAQSRSDTAQKKADAVVNKARRTGKADAVAATLLVHPT